MNSKEFILNLQKLMQQNKRQEVIAQILYAAQNGIPFEGNHINIAHYLFCSMEWDYINALLPEGTTWPLNSGWLNSINQNRPVNAGSLPIPWFTYAAIDFLTGIIRPSWHVFEWGCGNSTLWWANNVTSITGIEDNIDWLNLIKKDLPENATIQYKDNPVEYAEAINSFDGLFDCIVIDGKHRNQCTIAAIKKIAPSGIIVFDNSDRAEYQDADALLKKEGFFRVDFWGPMPSYLYKSCTSIYSKEVKQLNAPHPSQLNSAVGVSCDQVFTAKRNRDGR